jgi:hypothetical protein
VLKLLETPTLREIDLTPVKDKSGTEMRELIWRTCSNSFMGTKLKPQSDLDLSMPNPKELINPDTMK